METVIEYLVQNWGLVLVLIAFAIMLKVTILLDKHTIIRMSILIASVFVLSIIVYIEFHLSEIGEYVEVRRVIMAIRYSATPIIIALILYALVRKMRWYVIIPAFGFAVINVISIFTGIVFSINDTGELIRGPLGYLPYIAVGGYSVVLILVLYQQSNKQASEIFPIAFLASALGSGLILPFILGKDYSKIFCTTIGVALFIYYVFLILQLTKKDALTGLLNRQAYYSDVTKNKEITAFISIDMNGLKAINDNQGHVAGDEALYTLGRCFAKASKAKQSVYRIGGDEFMMICRKTSKEQLEELIEKIQSYVDETEYSCSIGYCYAPAGTKDHEEMIKESDAMMYANKAAYYSKLGNNRRNSK